MSWLKFYSAIIFHLDAWKCVQENPLIRHRYHFPTTVRGANQYAKVNELRNTPNTAITSTYRVWLHFIFVKSPHLSFVTYFDCKEGSQLIDTRGEILNSPPHSIYVVAVIICLRGIWTRCGFQLVVFATGTNAHAAENTREILNDLITRPLLWKTIRQLGVQPKVSFFCRSAVINHTQTNDKLSHYVIYNNNV